MNDKKPARELVDWQDEEGGVEALFMSHGVDLGEFDLTQTQFEDLCKMIYHYETAQQYWQLFEDSL